MAGLDWITVAADLPRQDKSILLGRKIGEPTRGWIYRVALWMWCADQCAEGRVTRDTDQAALLEFNMGWIGEPGRLLKACIECRVIDEEGDFYVIHGWEEHAAAHIEKRRKDAERQRKHREALAAKYASQAVTRDSRRRPGESRGNKNKNSNKNREAAAAAPAPTAEPPAAGVPAGTSTSAQGAAGTAEAQQHGPGPARVQPPAAPATDDVPRRLEVVDEADGYAAGPPAYPLASAFRSALRDRLARTALHPIGGGRPVWESLEAALRVVPPEEAVQVCADRVFSNVRESRRQPGTLAYFAQVLADVALERQQTQAPPSPAVMSVPTTAVEYLD